MQGERGRGVGCSWRVPRGVGEGTGPSETGVALGKSLSILCPCFLIFTMRVVMLTSPLSEDA